MSQVDNQREPGWYPLNGDPLGTVRYWDGESWSDDPVPAPEPEPEEEKGSRRVSAALALEFIGRPEIIETSGGLQVQIKVLNHGPIDALVSFQLKLDSGRLIEVTNPNAVIRAGSGPVRLELSSPLDSTIATNTKLSVVATNQGGATVAVSASSGGGLASMFSAVSSVAASVGPWAAAGIMVAGVGWGLLRDPETPPPPPNVELGEEEPASPEVTEELERAPASLLEGEYTLGQVDTNFEIVDDLAMSLALVLLSEEDCVECEYEVVFPWGGEITTIGQVRLGADTSRAELSATAPAGPVDGVCRGDDGVQVGDYRQDGPSAIEAAIATRNGAVELEARVVQTLDLVEGEPSERCPERLDLEVIYSHTGSTSYEITLPPPPPPPPPPTTETTETRPPPPKPDGFASLGSTTVTCEGEGQECSHELTFQVIDAEDGVSPEIAVTAGSLHCSSIAYTVVVGGIEQGSTGFLGASQTGAVAVGGVDVGSGPVAVAIRATGREEGCNRGSIRSWAASVELSGLLATESTMANQRR